MSIEELMAKVEARQKESEECAREYYAQNKGKRSCDTCTCSYESCACKGAGGLCAYE